MLDEGGLSLRDAPVTNAPMTLIGVAEKGYLTLQLEVKVAGGHSNAPGAQTAVDTLARAIVAIRANSFAPSYAGVTRDMLEAMAPHAPFVTRMAIANSWLLEPLLVRQLSATPQGAATLQTTIAPTMLQGSPKQNVLPTVATATINLRIMPGESIDSVTAHVRESIGDLPVTVTAVGTRSEPSPIASTQSGGYRLVAGLAAKMFDSPVAPLLMIGATDSRHMSVLTDDIYRFTPLQLDVRRRCARARHRRADLHRESGPHARVLSAGADRRHSCNVAVAHHFAGSWVRPGGPCSVTTSVGASA